MANRYTSTIYDGDQSVRDFMLNMAGGLGIFWDQVRDGGGSTRPQRIGDLALSFEEEVIDRKEKEREEILALTDEECAALALAEVDKQYEISVEIFNKQVARIERYKKMRAELEALDGPEEMESLKREALLELEKSWELDCSSGAAGEPPVRDIPLTGVEYRAREIRANDRQLRFFNEKMEEKRERHAKNKAFSDLIFDSLPEERQQR